MSLHSIVYFYALRKCNTQVELLANEATLIPQRALNKNWGNTFAESPKNTMAQMNAMSLRHLLTHELPIQSSNLKCNDGL